MFFFFFLKNILKTSMEKLTHISTGGDPNFPWKVTFSPWEMTQPSHRWPKFSMGGDIFPTGFDPNFPQDVTLSSQDVTQNTYMRWPKFLMGVKRFSWEVTQISHGRWPKFPMPITFLHCDNLFSGSSDWPCEEEGHQPETSNVCCLWRGRQNVWFGVWYVNILFDTGVGLHVTFCECLWGPSSQRFMAFSQKLNARTVCFA